MVMAAGYDGLLIGSGLLMEDIDIQEVLSEYSSAIRISKKSKPIPTNQKLFCPT